MKDSLILPIPQGAKSEPRDKDVTVITNTAELKPETDIVLLAVNLRYCHLLLGSTRRVKLCKTTVYLFYKDDC